MDAPPILFLLPLISEITPLDTTSFDPLSNASITLSSPEVRINPVLGQIYKAQVYPHQWVFIICLGTLEASTVKIDPYLVPKRRFYPSLSIALQ